MFVQKWSFIRDDFTIPGGEFTPTLKMKRSFIEKKYKGVIEQMYLENPSL
jgi:long-subunit acyl-CoA synthetase (AMP-forming)